MCIMAFVMTYDVIVAGGGPSGLLAAERIASKGHSVLVLEEHEEIGVPDHCAKLLSTTGLQTLGLVPPKKVIQNHVAGARIFSPAGHSISVERGKREALVVNRQEFDKWLAERAQRSGVEIRTDSKVREVHQSMAGYQIHVGSSVQTSTESTKIVLNAEGSRGILSKQLGLSSIPRSSKLPAYQYEMSNVSIDTSFVEMFYGNLVSKGFFAWIIPLGGERARIGVASRNHAKVRLQNAMRKHSPMASKLVDGRIERGFGGTVLVGLPAKEVARGAAMSLGDAAGIVKATTGGGIVLGGLVSQLAGDYVSRWLVSKKKIRLDGFEKIWRGYLYRELQMMHYAQKLLTAFSDRGIDTIVEGTQRYNLLEIVRREGDMDMQSKVILNLLRNPKMIVLGLQAIRYINPFI